MSLLGFAYKWFFQESANSNPVLTCESGTLLLYLKI